jgi:hypothetical protein
MVDLAREVCGGSIVGAPIAALGLAFEPNSDDIRDSPALNVAAQMRFQGASVVVTNPGAVDNAQRKWPDLRYAETADEAATEADLVLLLTEWDQHRTLNPPLSGRWWRGAAFLTAGTHLIRLLGARVKWTDYCALVPDGPGHACHVPFSPSPSLTVHPHLSRSRGPSVTVLGRSSSCLGRPVRASQITPWSDPHAPRHARHPVGVYAGDSHP